MRPPPPPPAPPLPVLWFLLLVLLLSPTLQSASAATPPEGGGIRNASQSLSTSTTAPTAAAAATSVAPPPGGSGSDGPRRAYEFGAVDVSVGVGGPLGSGSVRLELSGAVVGDELLLERGHDLQVRCDGDGRAPLLWSAPAADAASRAAALASAANDAPAAPGAVTGVTSVELRAPSADVNVTNLYCCARHAVVATLDNVTLVHNTDAQKCVYVFVKDPDNPIVGQRGLLTVSAIEGENVTLPCRSSSKDFEFRLKEFGPGTIQKNWSFDPRRGFTKVAALNDIKLLVCEYKDNTKKKQKYHLEVRSASKQVARPWLDAPLLLRENALMPLNCSVLLPPDTFATFRYDVAGIKADAPQMHETRARPVGKDKLLWQGANVGGVRAQKSGSVCCVVRDHVGNTNRSCSTVEVLPPGGGDPELRLRLDPRAPSPTFNHSGLEGAVTMERGPVFYWFVRVAWEGNDLPIAKWTDPDGVQTSVDLIPKRTRNPKWEVTVSWQPPPKDVRANPGIARHSTLVVKVPTHRAEAGNYSLEVRLGQRGRVVRREALRATLVGSPLPHLLNATPLVVVAGVEARVECVVRAEPPPHNVSWHWVLCNATGAGAASSAAGTAAAAAAASADACDDRAPTQRITDDVRTWSPEPGTMRSTLTLRDPPTDRWLRCDAANLRGAGSSQAAQLRLTAGAARGPSPGLVGGVVGVLALIMGFAGACVYFVLQRKRERRRLHCAGLQGLVAVEAGSLDPTLPADEQAEQLPYVTRWEFPRDHLSLGRQLGAGAFGVVTRAEARGILEDEEVTTVAVKMVKRGADDAYLRALASELKILVHLGRHLNVVNLLGACTGRIMEKELLVIVEYCPYGNLHNYLLRHRDGFVDQVDPRSGLVDATRGAAQLAAAEAAARRARLLLGSGESAYSMGGSSQQGSGDSGSLTAVTYCPTGVGGGHCTSGGSYDSGGAAVPLSPLPTDDSSSSGGPQPLWRTFYRCDSRAPSRLLCTADLLSWAYQVACGMQYLAQRKVLHGDLAARNVLLARDGIVKICDFGLARSMYKSDTYKKKGDGPLPIKWMALESIRDRIFSTQSDVWSFGVVMWELFSLGATPYPGMQPSEEFYNKLLSGYRMEHPPYAPAKVYALMSACWETDPRRRPAFEVLASELGELLDNSTRERFEHLVAYEQQKGGVGGECDYLAMLGSPDYGALTSPEEHVYVNTPQATEGLRPMAPEPNTSTNPDPETSTDYLNMSRPSTPGTSQVSFY